MAQQKTERMDKKIRDEMMRLLQERVNDPTLHWTRARVKCDDELFAGQLLKDARYFTDDGRITIAGMDYHRRETAKPILTWIRANWFAVVVAGCTIGVSVFGIVSG